MTYYGLFANMYFSLPECTLEHCTLDLIISLNSLFAGIVNWGWNNAKSTFNILWCYLTDRSKAVNISIIFPPLNSWYRCFMSTRPYFLSFFSLRCFVVECLSTARCRFWFRKLYSILSSSIHLKPLIYN